jgi:hypothetical protein
MQIAGKIYLTSLDSQKQQCRNSSTACASQRVITEDTKAMVGMSQNDLSRVLASPAIDHATTQITTSPGPLTKEEKDAITIGGSTAAVLGVLMAVHAELTPTHVVRNVMLLFEGKEFPVHMDDRSRYFIKTDSSGYVMVRKIDADRFEPIEIEVGTLGKGLLTKTLVEPYYAVNFENRYIYTEEVSAGQFKAFTVKQSELEIPVLSASGHPFVWASQEPSKQGINGHKRYVEIRNLEATTFDFSYTVNDKTTGQAKEVKKPVYMTDNGYSFIEQKQNKFCVHVDQDKKVTLINLDDDPNKPIKINSRNERVVAVGAETRPVEITNGLAKIGASFEGTPAVNINELNKYDKNVAKPVTKVDEKSLTLRYGLAAAAFVAGLAAATAAQLNLTGSHPATENTAASPLGTYLQTMHKLMEQRSRIQGQMR